MKRFIAVLSGLLVLPAFAEVAPVYYDEIVEYTDEMLDESDAQNGEIVEETTVKQPKIVQRNVAGRSVSRVTSAGNNAANSRTNTSSRAVAASPRNAQQTNRGTVSRTTKKQSTPTRTAVVSRSRANTARATTVSARNASTNTNATKARVSATGDVIPGVRNTTNSTSKILTDSGEPLYISNVARVGVSSRRSSARNSVPTNDNIPVITSEAVSSTTSNLDNLTELTDYCKAQYAQCMDNYCNVLDENQGRCSCSENITSYEETEKTLENITEQFQDVVQKIKYIGLTKPQIESLFKETEAEIAMKSNSDTSTLKGDLEKIKDMIIDVSDKKTSDSLTDILTFDTSGILNTDILSTFSLDSFLLGNTKVNQQRGKTLFNTATQRCKTAVLNSCVNQGIDANVITNSYDLAIDKQCIEYTNNLKEVTAEMRANVRNAQNILQQARLLLAQKKNEYDLRECVAALDECMQDEYVCGDDYELCLDPTGKYLAKGAIVKGGTPGVAGGSVRNQDPLDDLNNMISWTSNGMYWLYSTWDYGQQCPVNATSVDRYEGCHNAWGGRSENLTDYIRDKLATWASNNYKYTNWKTTTNDIATYLLRRVGYVDTKENKTYGMCADVLNKCQNYTFDNKGYIPDNEVVRQYLSLALTQIKMKQDEILTDYAETCWNTVYSCLSTNDYDEENTGNATSKTAVNACRGDIATCMSVTGYQPRDNTTLTLAAMSDWVAAKLMTCPENYFLKWQEATDTSQCFSCPVAVCEGITDETGVANHPECKNTICPAGIEPAYCLRLVSAGGQSTQCTCPEGYSIHMNNGAPSVAGSEATSGYETTFKCVPPSVGGGDSDCGWALIAYPVPGSTYAEVTADTTGLNDLISLSYSGAQYAAIRAVRNADNQCQCPQITYIQAGTPKTLNTTSRSAISAGQRQRLDEIAASHTEITVNTNFFCR